MWLSSFSFTVQAPWFWVTITFFTPSWKHVQLSPNNSNPDSSKSFNFTEYFSVSALSKNIEFWNKNPVNSKRFWRDFFILTQWQHFSRLVKQSTCSAMLRAASDSGVCVFAHLRYRQKSAIRLQERKGLSPSHSLHDISDLPSTFFNSLSICILIIRSPFFIRMTRNKRTRL